MKYSASFFSTATLLLAALTFSTIAFAQEEAPITEPPAVETTVAEPTTTTYSCTLNGMTRRIEIEYSEVGSSVPCSVNYYKDSELPGEVSTLWQANNTEGYCEDRAQAFSEKLASWGWACTVN